MKKNIYLILSLFLAIGLFKTALAGVVVTSGRQILVDNEPYTIKGICYQPVPKGSDQISWSTLTQDLALMNQAGINTIRVYSPIDNKAVLDEIDAAGIKIIMGFGYNMGGYFDILSGSYIDYIKEYKNHDAILLWEFGNEYNYHPEWFGNDINNWYSALNEAAADAKLEDPLHPTATAHGDLPTASILASCSNVDVWGMNVYRWDSPFEVGNDIGEQWESRSDKPMYLSEAGADRYMHTARDGYAQGVNEQAQADATRNILTEVMDNLDVCSGIAIFEFCDEWWKAGNNNSHDTGGIAPGSSGVPYDATANEEYWGIVDIDRNKTLAFTEVQKIFNPGTVNVNSESAEVLISLFPNPSKGNVSIEILADDLMDENYMIVNSAGASILSGKIKSKTVKINDLKPGVYYFTINGFKTSLIEKFVVN